MEVEIDYGGRKYRYSKVGEILTWVDDKDLTVPVMLHSILRDRAISSGIDKSIFLEARTPNKKPEKIKENKDTKKSPKKSKTKLIGSINPFEEKE